MAEELNDKSTPERELALDRLLHAFRLVERSQPLPDADAFVQRLRASTRRAPADGRQIASGDGEGVAARSDSALARRRLGGANLRWAAALLILMSAAAIVYVGKDVGFLTGDGSSNGALVAVEDLPDDDVDVVADLDELSELGSALLSEVFNDRLSAEDLEALDIVEELDLLNDPYIEWLLENS